ncbi:MAG: hypothetical protein KGH60_01670 [Candidatus Micrarchaeota archaeon]|nr:hypothetical protein [Candidatus Micrarchaeota archaeon]
MDWLALGPLALGFDNNYNNRNRLNLNGDYNRTNAFQMVPIWRLGNR